MRSDVEPFGEPLSVSSVYVSDSVFLVCAHVCASMWRPEVQAEHCLDYFTSYFLETDSAFPEPRAYCFALTNWLESPGTPPPRLLVLGLQMHSAMPPQPCTPTPTPVLEVELRFHACLCS